MSTRTNLTLGEEVSVVQLDIRRNDFTCNYSPRHCVGLSVLSRSGASGIFHKTKSLSNNVCWFRLNVLSSLSGLS